MGDKPISYIGSYLKTGEDLPRKHLLNARGTKAKRGEVVVPLLNVTAPARMEFMGKVMTQIRIGVTAKSLTASPETESKKSKYSVRVD